MVFISVAICFWMAWEITVLTLPADFFPARAVASVWGFGGAGSTTGSVISIWLVGRILYTTRSYIAVFTLLGLLMPAAYLAITALMGKVEPVELKE